MAVLTNTMMQGTAAISDEAGDYQIEKSVRLPREDDAWFTRSHYRSGNLRTWTWSAWVKKHATKSSEYEYIWGHNNPNGAHGEQIRFQDTGEINWYQYDGDGGNYSYRLQTNAKYRDPTAWLHIVAAFDSTNEVASDRMRLYVNGVRITSFSATTNPAQYLESSAINKSGFQQGLGRVGHSGSEDYNSNISLADVHFIDGLQLSAAAFGSFDSTGAWNAKAFARPAPNDGTTWSSGVAADSGSDTLSNPANGFNGTTGGSSIGGILGGWTWTSPSTLKNVYSLRFFSASYNTTGIIKLNGNVIETAYNFGGGDTWYDVPLRHLKAANYEVTSLSWNRNPTGNTNNNDYLNAVEVNGVILVDGQTDATGRTNPNNDIVWSNTFTGTFHSNGQGNAVNTFDGSLATQSFGADASTLTFLPPTTITATSKIEIYVYTKGSITGQNDLKVNNSSIYSAVNTALGNDAWGWYDIGKTLNSTHGLVVGRHDNDNKVNIKAIKVDGAYLLDSRVDNSFQLKFNDTTRNASVGQDTLNGKLTDATGALPIYNTTDDYGNVKGSGYRADSSAGTTDGTGLILAVPGDSVDTATCDVHQNINTGSSNVTIIDSDNRPVVSTNESRLYGSSLYFDGEDNRLRFASEAFGTGTFTVECWVNIDSTQSGAYHQTVGNLMGTAAGYWALTTRKNNQNKVCFAFTTGSGSINYIESNCNVNNNKWHHLAAVREGTGSDQMKLYIDGNLVKEHDCAQDLSQTSHWRLMKNDQSGEVTGTKGYIQDVRIYKGVTKYTSNFIPPTRNDWKVHRISHASNPGFEFGHNYDNYEFDSGWTSKAYDCTGSNIDAWEDMSTPKVMNLPGSGNQNSLRVYRTKDGSKRRWTLTTENSGGGSTGISAVGVSNDGINWTAPSGDQECGSGYTTAPGAWMTHAGGAWSKLTVSWTNDAITEVDVLPDSPTNYEDDDGGIHGNYATLNENQKHNGITLKQGNLAVGASTGNAWKYTKSTIGMKTGKWYCEMGPNLYKDSNNHCQPGVSVMSDSNTIALSSASGHAMYHYGGNLYINNTNAAFGAAWSSSSFNQTGIIGIAFDADTRKIWFSKDGVWQDSGNPSAGSNEAGVLDLVGGGVYAFTLGTYGGLSGDVPVNFGANGFKYTVPTGFKALCTQNLDDTFSGAEVNDPSKYFDITTYTGTGASRDIKGVGFGPDLIWVKERGGANDHQVYDQVRGTGKRIRPNTNDKEATQSGGVNAFLSDGWTQGDAGTMNNSGDTYVGWLWDAGTAASGANNDGATNVSSGDQWVNASAGFSITKYSGGSGTTTVGHGLSAKPDFVIVKCLGTTDSQHWTVWHNILDDGDYLRLNDDSAAIDYAMFNDGQPTNTVVPLGNDGQVSNSGDTYIMYAWTAITGYSIFSSYVGNASADGPFVYCGFRPRWVMVKNTDAGGSSNSGRNWVIRDTARDDDNPVKNYALADASNGGYTYEGSNGERFIDITANGFKVRSAVGSGDHLYTPNVSGNKYLVAAFAEHPFKTARAR